MLLSARKMIRQDGAMSLLHHGLLSLLPLLLLMMLSLCASLASAGHALSLVAETTTTAPTTTPSRDDLLNLNLTCSLSLGLPSADTDISKVMILQLQKVTGSVVTPLASVVSGEHARFNTDFPHATASVLGGISDSRPRDSFLQLTVQNPQNAGAGEYVCKMSYLDRNTQLLMHEEATANITDLTSATSAATAPTYPTTTTTTNTNTATTTTTIVASTNHHTDTYRTLDPNLSAVLVMELQKLREQVANLTQALQESATSSNASALHAAHTDTPTPPVVAFSAQPEVNQPYVNETLTFGNVTLNEGEGYKASTGCFVAPANGSYALSATVSINVGKILVNMEVNGHTEAQLAAVGDDQSSVSRVLDLQADDTVCLQGVFANNDHIRFFADGDTAFSGFLLPHQHHHH